MNRLKNIQKILIANRGEIAERIIRTCRKVGVTSVAVYSEPDRDLPYVRAADEAYPLPGTYSSETYLRGEKIIEIALQCGADAIHPGYGFLSESAKFARQVGAQNLIFIGPSPESIESMGNKIEAKKLAAAAGVPLIPGKASPVSDVEEAVREAGDIGYPVLLKAAAGGGGKGMRTIRGEKEMRASFHLVKGEAESAFGDGSVFVEKYIVRPKHVEIQIFGDQHGNLVSLFERDCSIQRRHQKVIEEAPCAVIREETRRKMGAAALRLAEAVDYYSSGTLEFLMDEEQNFYFLEMNTRLQVEHPVTELITGTDLVEWQLLVADGQPLPKKQEDLNLRGHAIELRLYAEKYLDDFAPSPGRIERLELPAHPAVRLDMGFAAGNEVTLFYDPMIGKIICFAENREHCLKIFREWMKKTRISGVDTTLPFGLVVLDSPEFRAGTYSISFYEEIDRGKLEEREKKLGEIAALFADHLIETEKTKNFLLE